MQRVFPIENKHSQYKYIFACIIIVLVSFEYYALLSADVYSMGKILLQFMAYYFVMKSNETQGNHLLRLCLLSLVFIAMSVYYELYDFLVLHNHSAIFIAVSVDLIIGMVMLYFSYFFKNDKREGSNTHIILFFNIFLIATILCAIATGNESSGQIPYPFIWIVFGILHVFYSCHFNNQTSKMWILGNVLMALYFTVVRLYMISYSTDVIKNTGWAATYARSICIELLITHICIAIVALFLHKILVKTRCFN